MIVDSRIPPPPPEPAPQQIMSTTIEAEGVYLGPQHLKELKALTMKLDKQRTKAMADEDWCSILDHVQYLFWASSILFRLAHLLCHLLAVCHNPAPSKTLLVKVLVVGQNKLLEATCQQI